MRRKIVLFIIIAICFLLQTTVFRALTFANIGPNLLIIVVSSFGLMRGKKKGCGLDSFVDCLSTYFLGFILEDMLYFICTSVTSTDCSKKDFTRMILSFR